MKNILLLASITLLFSCGEQKSNEDKEIEENTKKIQEAQKEVDSLDNEVKQVREDGERMEKIFDFLIELTKVGLTQEEAEATLKEKHPEDYEFYMEHK